MGSVWIYERLIRLLALLPALTLHEFAHAYCAHRCGDPTPAAHGRVTLNPLAHLDPMGTLMILFSFVGWAKPVPINPANFRHPSRDTILTSAVGPLSNLAQGAVWCMAIRMLLALRIYNEFVIGILAMMVLINFCLCIFNLLPLGPLDGHHILEYKLPYRMASKYRAWNRQYGFVALFAIFFVSHVLKVPILQYVILLPSWLLGSLLAGRDIYDLIHLLYL
jgi:Zn-dependent protease